MSLAYTVVTSTIKRLTRILCKVDDSQLSKVPQQGPLILVCNHINSIEVPVMFTHLQPRKITGFAKAETWDNPLMGSLFTLWGAIPIQRGEADTTAFRKAIEALHNRKMLAIAPEGTRSGTGQLGRGLPGIVKIAQYSSADILPIAYYGGEKFRDNISRLKRTEFHIRVGKVLRISFPSTQIDRDIRNQIVDEIMFQLALLLPAEYRGYYSDVSRATLNYLHFA